MADPMPGAVYVDCILCGAETPARLHGSYFPPTRFEPTEYPEIELDPQCRCVSNPCVDAVKWEEMMEERATEMEGYR